jgi:hypothetical protein
MRVRTLLVAAALLIPLTGESSITARPTTRPRSYHPRYHGAAPCLLMRPGSATLVAESVPD